MTPARAKKNPGLAVGVLLKFRSSAWLCVRVCLLSPFGEMT